MCKSCEERRNDVRVALSQGNAIKAAQYAMLGAAEMIGLKKKPDSESK